MAMIIHIIGKVGAGKTHFIKQYCPYAPVFDIKSVYEKYNFKPDQLQGGLYRQYASALFYTLDNFRRQYATDPFVVVESSGINKAMNAYLEHLPHITIYVESSFSKHISKSRDYADKINPIIDLALKSNEIRPKVRYDGDLNQFSPSVPEIFHSS